MCRNIKALALNNPNSRFFNPPPSFKHRRARIDLHQLKEHLFLRCRSFGRWKKLWMRFSGGLEFFDLAFELGFHRPGLQLLDVAEQTFDLAVEQQYKDDRCARPREKLN